jgi:hypothetical protein
MKTGAVPAKRVQLLFLCALKIYFCRL